jgi:hypothetical protein
METLEAIILLLADAPVLCWLAIDSRLVEASIEERNKNMMEAAGVSGYNRFAFQILTIKISGIFYPGCFFMGN